MAKKHDNDFKVLIVELLKSVSKSKELGDKSIELSSHGSMKILTTHYTDNEFIAKGLTMKIFE